MRFNNVYLFFGFFLIKSIDFLRQNPSLGIKGILLFHNLLSSFDIKRE
jgi:hypothetical protein